MLKVLYNKDNLFIYVFFLSGLFGFVWSCVRRKKSVQLTGEIVDYYQNSQLYYVPVVRFVYLGQEYKIKLDKGFRRKLADVGGLLEIYFLPGKLESVRLATDKRDIWYSLVLIFCSFISVFFLMI